MAISAQQVQVIDRCRASVSWFLSNCCKLKHPSAGILPFKPFGYQRHAIKCFRKHRFNIFRKCRQAGVSKISGAFAIWYAMFHSNKTVLIVSRTDLDAMGFLRDHVVFLFRNLPQWMQEIWKPTKENEHEIVFPNGSRISSLTSHPDVLRSNAASLNIIDEAAFIQNADMMWAAGWPTLQHGGSSIVISTCVSPDTYILSDNGMELISNFTPSEYEEHSGGYDITTIDANIVASDGELSKATKFYRREPEATKIIKTVHGYQIEASTRHRLKFISNRSYDYHYVSEIACGDYIPIIRGTQRFGTSNNINFKDTGSKSDENKKHQTSLKVDSITEDWAYLIGLIVAEGSIEKTRVIITNGDESVRNKLYNNKLGLNWRPTQRKTHLCCSSTRLVRFLDWLGLSQRRAWDKIVPDKLLSCSREIIIAFLRGLYDGDGHSRTRDGEIGLTSTSYKLIKQVRLMLLNIGIICREEYHPAYTKEFKLNRRHYTSECRESWQLLISSGEAPKFFANIGFDIDRKSTNRSKCKNNREFIPGAPELIRRFRADTKLSITAMAKLGIHNTVLFGRKDRPLRTLSRDVVNKFLRLAPHNDNINYQKLKELADPMIFWDTVESVTDGISEVMDFTIPNKATFWSNGFDSHNTNGIGGWYWSTMTDAEAGVGPFNPITINWWDMDWAIEFTDPLSREKRRIAPRDGIRECKTKAEIEKYGPYWSPWLEEQYRALQQQGEAWKFEQEVLASFVGSGNTVLPKSVLNRIEVTVQQPKFKVTGDQEYVNPVTGAAETLSFDFEKPEEGLWVWENPVTAKPQKRKGSLIIEAGAPAHAYVMGVDTATGKGKDYSAIEVFDINTMKQVAELMVHCLPRTLAKYIDLIGRWYNCALAVIERNNGGDTLIDMMRYDYMYPRLWRKKDINDRPSPKRLRSPRAIKVRPYGFATGQNSKATLNKFLLDYIRDVEDEGYQIYSSRLLKQFQTYVRKRDKTGHDTNRTEAEDGAGNFDDLVMATGLALIGTSDAYITDGSNLSPLSATSDFKSIIGPTIQSHNQQVASQSELLEKGGPSIMLPMNFATDDDKEVAIQRQLDAFTCQLGGIPISQNGKPMVVPPKYYYQKKA